MLLAKESGREETPGVANPADNDMTRLLLAMALVLSTLPPARASLSQPRDRSGSDRTLSAGLARAFSTPLGRPASGPSGREEFRLTEDSEILLDGRPCSYKDVPGNVSITHMELGADKKTILKIHFRTRR
jgi:hypothetical protein